MDFSFEARESINGQLAVHLGYTSALYCHFIWVFLKEVCGILKEAGRELSVVWKNKSHPCTAKEGLAKDLDENMVGPS